MDSHRAIVLTMLILAACSSPGNKNALVDELETLTDSVNENDSTLEYIAPLEESFVDLDLTEPSSHHESKVESSDEPDSESDRTVFAERLCSYDINNYGVRLAVRSVSLDEHVGKVYISLYWLNGVGEYGALSSPGEMGMRCSQAIPELLPSSILGYEFDIETAAVEFLGAAVLHAADSYALLQMLSLNNFVNTTHSPYVFRDYPPYATYNAPGISPGDGLMSGMYINHFGKLYFASAPYYASVCRTPGDNCLDPMPYSVEVTARTINVFSVLKIVDHARSEDGLLVVEHEKAIPFPIGVELLSADHVARSGCGCLQDNSTPLDVVQSFPCGQKDPSGKNYYNCGKTGSDQDYGCCSSEMKSFFYYLPWEGEDGTLFYADGYIAWQFRKTVPTGKYNEYGEAENLTDITSRGFPDDYWWETDMVFYEDHNETIAARMYPVGGEGAGQSLCAYHTASFYAGVKAALEVLNVRLSPLPGRVVGHYEFDDSILPPEVSLPACDRVRDFALPIWDVGRRP
jgi:hypothetical protein